MRRRAALRRLGSRRPCGPAQVEGSRPDLWHERSWRPRSRSGMDLADLKNKKGTKSRLEGKNQRRQRRTGSRDHMITVLVRVTMGWKPWPLTFSCPRSRVAAGLVGDAVILAPRADGHRSEVADAAGATSSCAGPILDAMARRRAARLAAVPRDGDIPQEGWIRCSTGSSRSEARARAGADAAAGLLAALVDLCAPPHRPRRRSIAASSTR